MVNPNHRKGDTHRDNQKEKVSYYVIILVFRILQQSLLVLVDTAVGGVLSLEKTILRRSCKVDCLRSTEYCTRNSSIALKGFVSFRLLDSINSSLHIESRGMYRILVQRWVYTCKREDQNKGDIKAGLFSLSLLSLEAF